MFLILVLLFVSLAAGQTQPAKKPCCYPDSWQATVVDIGTEFDSEEVDGELEEFTNFGLLLYDWTHQRVMRQFHQPRTRYRATIYTDFAKGKRYKHTYGGGCSECVTTDITFNMTHCIPANATFLGSVYFGYGDNRLELDEWHFQRQGSDYRQFVTTKECYPVADELFKEDAGDTNEEARWIYDIKPIQDAQLLSIPDLCINNNRGGGNRGKRCTTSTFISHLV